MIGSGREPDIHDYTYHLYEEWRAGRMSRRGSLQRATIAGVSRRFDGELDEQPRRELAARLQREEIPVIIAYWIRELRPVRNHFQGLAKVRDIVLDMSPVCISE